MEWQDDVVEALEPTSEDDTPSFDGDGVAVVFTAHVTLQPDGRLLAALSTIDEAEVCASVAAVVALVTLGATRCRAPTTADPPAPARS